MNVSESDVDRAVSWIDWRASAANAINGDAITKRYAARSPTNFKIRTYGYGLGSVESSDASTADLKEIPLLAHYRTLRNPLFGKHNVLASKNARFLEKITYW